MAGRNSHPPLTPSASRLRGPDSGLRHSASAAPLRSSSPAAFIPPLEWFGEICGEQPAFGEVLGDPHASGEVGGEPHASGEVHGELQGGSELQRKKSRKKVTVTQSEKISPTAGSKRPLSEASGSLRASKSAKVMNAKVVMTQLENSSKTVGRKLAPIVSRSPMTMARKRAHSHASSPNLAGTSKTPSLHDLSAAATSGTPTSMHDLSHDATNGTPTSMHDLSLAATSGTPTSMHDLSPDATNGSTRKSRRLTSTIWKDAEPIYVGRFLMQGRCKYCGNVFPASRATGTSQLGRHLKVCEVKNSMDGVMKQIKTSVEIVPDWEFDQEAVRSELSPAASNGTPTSMHDLSPDATDGTPTSMHDLSPAATSCTPTSMHDLSPDPTNGTSTSMHDLPPTATNGSKRKQRKLTSIIWKDAEPIYIDGVLMQGRCNYCNNVFPASRVSGTSQLGRHLKVCEVKNSMDGVIQQIKTSDEIDPDWKFDQEAARSELVKLIVLHGLPFSFVEYYGFRKFCASLNPWFKSVNRVTIENDCMDAYHQYKNAYESFFKNCNYRVSLSCDMWTSNQKLEYLCITCHWIDSKWKVRHKIIRFCLVETPHDAWNMFGVVLNSLRDWNIENKLFSFTTDNAEVNTKMVSHLRKNLVDRNLIHHEGKLLHIRCAAHVLNLVVQDGLRTMKSVVDNIRENVKYIRSSQFRKEQFAKMVAKVGIKCKHQPSLDVSTRWNSTFQMLESTLPFRKVFETLEEQEPNYTFGPSDEEWKMVEEICQLLKVFCHATNVISGSNYPTSNLYFLEIWSVKLVLDEQAKSDNGTIRIMVNEMKKKFHMYFMESYLTNCIPVILDPRFKMQHVEFRLKQYFGVDADKHIQEVRTAIEALFTEYAAEFEDNVDILSQERKGQEVALADSALSDWDEHVKLKKAKNRDELQRYLDEDFHPRTPDFDILKWWAVNSARYPTLGNIARDVLPVPASSIASESAFSTCRRVITDHRSSLAAETVEALMCFGDWIRPSGSSSSKASTPHVMPSTVDEEMTLLKAQAGEKNWSEE
ncbi:zinc finger BED domain-containing protein RICESLEEPER 2 isoform X1 [Lolium perenne]|uniref:zinc finger BED domain-containing protein RICESLEEPER 2 isoform X1 n=1 Tax=Lolium perenne TaxID=4522 RepID=UPI0021F51B34|nr:zinc finger BED domain-containing protein RICESLEEPER 2-like isoform X1 [Lolium perenne]